MSVGIVRKGCGHKSDRRGYDGIGCSRQKISQYLAALSRFRKESHGGI